MEWFVFGVEGYEIGRNSSAGGRTTKNSLIIVFKNYYSNVHYERQGKS